jgi:hypothetical protein
VGGSGEQAGALEFGAVAAPLAELVTAAAAGEPLEAELSLTLTELPTAVADALLEAQGLLVDLLGPAVSCELSARPGAAQPSAWLELQASSDVAQLDCAMELREGVLVPSADRPLDLHFELTPLSSPRVVGPLVPLLAEVRSVAGEGRAALRLEDFQLPLDGDLQRLSGRLVLDLGVVQATWVPGLEWLAGRSVGRLGPYEFTLAEGLAHYDHFRLTIDGRAVPLTGQVNLLDRTLSLGAELPLGAIGGEAGELLRAAREVLDPATAVPVRLSGSWPAVELDVDTEGVLAAARGALEGRISEELEEWTGGARDSVEQAAKELLERGLRDLFGRRKDG